MPPLRRSTRVRRQFSERLSEAMENNTTEESEDEYMCLDSPTAVNRYTTQKSPESDIDTQQQQQQQQPQQTGFRQQVRKRRSLTQRLAEAKGAASSMKKEDDQEWCEPSSSSNTHPKRRRKVRHMSEESEDSSTRQISVGLDTRDGKTKSGRRRRLRPQSAILPPTTGSTGATWVERTVNNNDVQDDEDMSGTYGLHKHSPTSKVVSIEPIIIGTTTTTSCSSKTNQQHNNHHSQSIATVTNTTGEGTGEGLPRRRRVRPDSLAEKLDRFAQQPAVDLVDLSQHLYIPNVVSPQEQQRQSSPLSSTCHEPIVIDDPTPPSSPTSTTAPTTTTTTTTTNPPLQAATPSLDRATKSEDANTTTDASVRNTTTAELYDTNTSLKKGTISTTTQDAIQPLNNHHQVMDPGDESSHDTVSTPANSQSPDHHHHHHTNMDISSEQQQDQKQSSTYFGRVIGTVSRFIWGS
ncbi:hypothetical protein LRAMOSA09874 [Lichtheimia ramosa]|uniref:Uncharacterized protein n=1 Tax=Lichtheimia ramosa TaxID=688394 RepID=A0A077WN30_9FUNG|nr:hypothetical protein LRAMOSA09874 [Lichtheimia ramosa]